MSECGIASRIIDLSHCGLPPKVCTPYLMIVSVLAIWAHIVDVDIGRFPGEAYGILKNSIPQDLLHVLSLITDLLHFSFDIQRVSHTSSNVHVGEAMFDSPMVFHIDNDIKNDRSVDNDAVVS